MYNVCTCRLLSVDATIWLCHWPFFMDVLFAWFYFPQISYTIHNWIEDCASPFNCCCNVAVSITRRYRVQCKSNAIFFLRGAVSIYRTLCLRIGLTECRAIFDMAPNRRRKTKLFTFRAANEMNLALFETMKWKKKQFAKLSKWPTSPPPSSSSPPQPSPCASMRVRARIFRIANNLQCKISCVPFNIAEATRCIKNIGFTSPM